MSSPQMLDGYIHVAWQKDSGLAFGSAIRARPRGDCRPHSVARQSNARRAVQPIHSGEQFHAVRGLEIIDDRDGFFQRRPIGARLRRGQLCADQVLPVAAEADRVKRAGIAHPAFTGQISSVQRVQQVSRPF
jgi:hypothetical protein